jgi:hypothetical protein
VTVSDGVEQRNEWRRVEEVEQHGWPSAWPPVYRGIGPPLA